jgi:hypothetical protein
MAKWKRRQIWRHNGFSGHVSMSIKNLEDILWSPTTTQETKQLAANIRPLLGDLMQSLKDRADPSTD